MPIFSQTKESLEKAFRSFVPVESFVQDKAETVIIAKPNVGMRWGKPADFEFDLSDLKQQRKQGKIIEVPRYYFENEILDFTEQWRAFIVGDVHVQKVELFPTYNKGEPWPDYLGRIRYVTYPADHPRVELEQLRSWIADSGISWQRFDSNGDPVANVTVYYQFDIDSYIPFLEEPKLKFGERGEHPSK